VKNNTIEEIMNVETVEPGDVFFTPAGRVHAIGAGIVLVEIQQTSDITYRIFDWNRKGTGKEKRELHTELALDAIDFKQVGSNKVKTDPTLNSGMNLVNCEFFNTNLLWFDKPVEMDYTLIDSFVVYICTEGEFQISWDGNTENVIKGETVLLPAMIKEVTLKPLNEARLLEVLIP